MRVILDSTTRVVDIQGDTGAVPGRIWEGKTDSGIPVFAAVTRIAVRDDRDLSQFEAELLRCRDNRPGPESALAIPARLVL